MRKRIIIYLLLIIGSYSVSAQNPYKNSIGGIIGFIQGGSYKTFVSNNFAIQVDFGLKILHYAPGIDANGNFMYEQAIKDGFYWFAGGGLSLGPAFGGTVFTPNPSNNINVGFKFGINSIGGAEYKFKNIPLTLQADIRPGVLFYVGNAKYEPGFDYSFLNASARYTF